VGYAVAAVAPVALGVLRDATGGFTAPFGVLTVMAVLEAAIGTQLGPQYRRAIG
jgi:cyanate permease